MLKISIKSRAEPWDLKTNFILIPNPTLYVLESDQVFVLFLFQVGMIKIAVPQQF